MWGDLGSFFIPTAKQWLLQPLGFGPGSGAPEQFRSGERGPERVPEKFRSGFRKR